MASTGLEGRTLHFIGIGGAGMSGLALVARQLGAAVTGSDQAESSYFTRLRAAGIEPVIGHAASNVPEGAELVVSTAIPQDNPELVPGAVVLHRGDLLGELSRSKRTIAVAGTHGKTTTASMAALALLRCGREPAFLIGGELRAAETNAAWGEGDWAVIEADESDRSFLKLARDVAVVTNVELDHHSTYRDLGQLEAAFQEFAEPAAARVLGPGVELGGGGRTVRFDLEDGDARGREGDLLLAREVELHPGGSRFTVEDAAVELQVPGRHNVLNALAALAACREAGLAIAEAGPALAAFTGAGRRFEGHGRTPSGALVYDDYAHHPTEVRATLEAARTLEPRRLVACFQPHLYSRTRDAGGGLRPGAGPGRCRGCARRLPGPRAGRAVPRGERPAGGPGGRRRISRASRLVASRADRGRAHARGRAARGRPAGHARRR